MVNPIFFSSISTWVPASLPHSFLYLQPLRAVCWLLLISWSNFWSQLWALAVCCLEISLASLCLTIQWVLHSGGGGCRDSPLWT